jgi:hypothetical protein
MHKRTRSTLLLIIVLAALTLAALILRNQKQGSDNFFTEFAVSDTSNITSITLTDRDDRQVTLERVSSGQWKLNHRWDANQMVVESLLKTLYDIEVKGLVPKSGYNTAVSNLSAKNTFIQIYQRVPLISIRSLKLFPRIKMTKAYYVGGPTQDYLGTYMKPEKSDKVYITYVPGQNAFLSLRYSTTESDWRDHTIIALTIQQIKSIEVEVPGRPDESYHIEKTGDRTFRMYQYDDKPVTIPLDTNRVLEFMASFRNIKYEGLINDIEKQRKDSILHSIPMQTITVTSVKGEKQTMTTFRRKSPYPVDEITQKELKWDQDRLYVVINNGNDLTLCQFYVFDEILKPFTWFRADYTPSHTGYFTEE